MSDTTTSYIPALGFHWLTRFYDPVIRFTLREEYFKQRLIAQARVRPGDAVLDLGCGTGTLTTMIKRACPDANVVGLDVDPEILAIARRKAAAAGVDIELRQGLAYAPPFAAGSFDRVLTSLVLHHLSTADKIRTLAAVKALLRSGGELHIADWGKPHNLLMAVAAYGIRMLDGAATTQANLDGLIPAMMREAGFERVAEMDRMMTMFGTLSLYRGVVS
jgi:ubiquinone/menaquinone biosynthesis C-methylase UbiE